MLPVPNESSPAAPNNPARRVRELLLEFQATMPTVEDNAMLVLMKMLDEPQESARIYHSMTELRLQAESVPRLMEQYAEMPGYAGYLDHYPQILDATKRLHMPHQYPATAIFDSIDNGGWSALRFASDVLGYYAAEGSLTKDQEADYLAQVRAVIDAVASDETLSRSDRSRIVDLLRKVEQALVDIKINGALPVQEAAAAAGVIVRLSFWERVRSRPWARDFVVVVAALFAALEATANTLAIEQYFSDQPQKVVVIESSADDTGHRIGTHGEHSDEDQHGPR
jgi:hypothetical protein